MSGQRDIDKTHLSLDNAEERGFIHRDYIAHCLRWSHVVKHLGKKNLYKKARILDIGCGKEMPLLKTLYTMKMTPREYMGVDVNRIQPTDMHRKIMDKMGHDHFFLKDEWDFSKDYDFAVNDPHVIVCFEMLEHSSPAKVIKILANIHKIADKDTTIFISTPCFNGKAAANHINEMTYEFLETLLITRGFNIVSRWGTFASQKDIEPQLKGDSLQQAYECLKDYYDSNLLSILFAPLFPKYSRNVIWKLMIS